MSEKNIKVKTPPNSKESEMMVLGCMLTSYNSLNIAADALAESDFYFFEHKIIFKGLKQLYQKDKPADIHLLTEELKSEGKLKEVGDIGYLTTLAQYAGTSAYIEEYAALVKDKSILRQIININEDVSKKALSDPKDVGDLLDHAQARLFNVSQATNKETGVLVKDILSGLKSEDQIPYLKKIEEKQEDYRIKGPEVAGITGLPTNFLDLDKLINGLNPSLRSETIVARALPSDHPVLPLDTLK
jgi:replicative DNA helicase